MSRREAGERVVRIHITIAMIDMIEIPKYFIRNNLTC